MGKYMKQMNEQELASLKFAIYHLSEAIDEITNALTTMAITHNVDCTDPGIREHLVHAYQHLNWYWNGSSTGKRDFPSLPDEEYRELSKFPADIAGEM